MFALLTRTLSAITTVDEMESSVEREEPKPSLDRNVRQRTFELEDEREGVIMQKSEPRFDTIAVKQKSNEAASKKHNAEAKTGAVLSVTFDSTKTTGTALPSVMYHVS
jgi:hypothetical protein